MKPVEAYLDDLAQLNEELFPEGIQLRALFGSHVRGEATETSDLDVLYKADPAFYQKYRGLAAYRRLEQIREMIREKSGSEVDLVAEEFLTETGKKYILPEMVYA